MVRRTAFITMSAAAFLAIAAAPAAADVGGDSGWQLTPSSPVDIPAGRTCAFPMHLDFPVDKVRERVLQTYPDGSVKQDEYVGPLIVRVTNMDSGASTDVNASGRAVVDYGTDGSQTWHVTGPVLMGFRATGTNHEQGFFRLVGEYTVRFDSTGTTMLMANGTEENICDVLS